MVWILLGAGLLLYSMGSGLLEKLGLKQSAEGKNIQDALSRTDNAFSPNFYKNKETIVIRFETAKAWAKIIYNAGRGWGTDEGAIFGILRRCKSQCDVSGLAEVFGMLYKTSLIDFLDSEFDEKEMAQAIAIVNSLPAYIRK